MSRGSVQARDEDLLAAVIRGERGAWPTFSARFERLLIACVRKTFARYTSVIREEDVEDVVSMVYLGLLKDDHHKLRSFDETRGYQLSSWLGLIATNTALDTLRRRRGPTHVSLDLGGDDDPLQVPAAGGDPQTLLLEREEREALVAAIEELPAADHEFMSLYYEHDLAPEELAHRLGISVKTVYSRKNKLRIKLRRRIDELSGKVRKTSA